MHSDDQTPATAPADMPAITQPKRQVLSHKELIDAARNSFYIHDAREHLFKFLWKGTRYEVMYNGNFYGYLSMYGDPEYL